MTVGQLIALEVVDIRDRQSPLMKEIASKLPVGFEDLTEEHFAKLSPRHAHYARAVEFDSVWSRGGMQAVVLGKPPEMASRLLKSMVETATFFGAKVAMAFVREARTEAMEAAVAISVLKESGEDDDEMFAPYWDKLDLIDETFEAYFEDLFKAVRQDIQRDPLAWSVIELAKAS